jgi:hypothetical protein
MSNDSLTLAVLAVVVILIIAAFAYHHYQKAAVHAHHLRSVQGAEMHKLATYLARRSAAGALNTPAAQYDYQAASGRYCAADLGEQCW